MHNDIISVSCPICGRQVEWNEKSPFRPFCSKRCQFIDFGEWIEEERGISSDAQPTESNDGVIKNLLILQEHYKMILKTFQAPKLY